MAYWLIRDRFIIDSVLEGLAFYLCLRTTDGGSLPERDATAMERDEGRCGGAVLRSRLSLGVYDS
jgi:hypothetical protein